jgi:hypothetical protein
MVSEYHCCSPSFRYIAGKSSAERLAKTATSTANPVAGPCEMHGSSDSSLFYWRRMAHASASLVRTYLFRIRIEVEGRAADAFNDGAQRPETMMLAHETQQIRTNSRHSLLVARNGIPFLEGVQHVAQFPLQVARLSLSPQTRINILVAHTRAGAAGAAGNFGAAATTTRSGCGVIARPSERLE